jgi:hypothetical protein
MWRNMFGVGGSGRVAAVFAAGGDGDESSRSEPGTAAAALAPAAPLKVATPAFALAPAPAVAPTPSPASALRRSKVSPAAPVAARPAAPGAATAPTASAAAAPRAPSESELFYCHELDSAIYSTKRSKDRVQLVNRLERDCRERTPEMRNLNTSKAILWQLAKISKSSMADHHVVLAMARAVAMLAEDPFSRGAIQDHGLLGGAARPPSALGEPGEQGEEKEAIAGAVASLAPAEQNMTLALEEGTRAEWLDFVSGMSKQSNMVALLPRIAADSLKRLRALKRTANEQARFEAWSEVAVQSLLAAVRLARALPAVRQQLSAPSTAELALECYRVVCDVFSLGGHRAESTRELALEVASDLCCVVAQGHFALDAFVKGSAGAHALSGVAELVYRAPVTQMQPLMHLACCLEAVGLDQVSDRGAGEHLAEALFYKLNVELGPAVDVFLNEELVARGQQTAPQEANAASGATAIATGAAPPAGEAGDDDPADADADADSGLEEEEEREMRDAEQEYNARAAHNLERARGDSPLLSVFRALLGALVALTSVRVYGNPVGRDWLLHGARRAAETSIAERGSRPWPSNPHTGVGSAAVWKHRLVDEIGAGNKVRDDGVVHLWLHIARLHEVAESLRDIRACDMLARALLERARDVLECAATLTSQHEPPLAAAGMLLGVFLERNDQRAADDRMAESTVRHLLTALDHALTPREGESEGEPAAPTRDANKNNPRDGRARRAERSNQDAEDSGEEEGDGREGAEEKEEEGRKVGEERGDDDDDDDDDKGSDGREGELYPRSSSANARGGDGAPSLSERCKLQVATVNALFALVAAQRELGQEAVQEIFELSVRLGDHEPAVRDQVALGIVGALVHLAPLRARMSGSIPAGGEHNGVEGGEVGVDGDTVVAAGAHLFQASTRLLMEQLLPEEPSLAETRRARAQGWVESLLGAGLLGILDYVYEWAAATATAEAPFVPPADGVAVKAAGEGGGGEQGSLDAPPGSAARSGLPLGVRLAIEVIPREGPGAELPAQLDEDELKDFEERAAQVERQIKLAALLDARETKRDPRLWAVADVLDALHWHTRVLEVLERLTGLGATSAPVRSALLGPEPSLVHALLTAAAALQRLRERPPWTDAAVNKVLRGNEFDMYSNAYMVLRLADGSPGSPGSAAGAAARPAPQHADELAAQPLSGADLAQEALALEPSRLELLAAALSDFEELDKEAIQVLPLLGLLAEMVDTDVPGKNAAGALKTLLGKEADRRLFLAALGRTLELLNHQYQVDGQELPLELVRFAAFLLARSLCDVDLAVEHKQTPATIQGLCRDVVTLLFRCKTAMAREEVLHARAAAAAATGAVRRGAAGALEAGGLASGDELFQIAHFLSLSLFHCVSSDPSLATVILCDGHGVVDALLHCVNAAVARAESPLDALVAARGAASQARPAEEAIPRLLVLVGSAALFLLVGAAPADVLAAVDAGSFAGGPAAEPRLAGPAAATRRRGIDLGQSSVFAFSQTLATDIGSSPAHNEHHHQHHHRYLQDHQQARAIGQKQPQQPQLQLHSLHRHQSPREHVHHEPSHRRLPDAHHRHAHHRHHHHRSHRSLLVEQVTRTVERLCSLILADARAAASARAQETTAPGGDASPSPAAVSLSSAAASSSSLAAAAAAAAVSLGPPSSMAAESPLPSPPPLVVSPLTQSPASAVRSKLAQPREGLIVLLGVCWRIALKLQAAHALVRSLIPILSELGDELAAAAREEKLEPAASVASLFSFDLLDVEHALIEAPGTGHLDMKPRVSTEPDELGEDGSGGDHGEQSERGENGEQGELGDDGRDDARDEDGAPKEYSGKEERGAMSKRGGAHGGNEALDDIAELAEGMSAMGSDGGRVKMGSSSSHSSFTSQASKGSKDSKGSRASQVSKAQQSFPAGVPVPIPPAPKRALLQRPARRQQQGWSGILDSELAAYVRQASLELLDQTALTSAQTLLKQYRVALMSRVPAGLSSLAALKRFQQLRLNQLDRRPSHPDDSASSRRLNDEYRKLLFAQPEVAAASRAGQRRALLAASEAARCTLRELMHPQPAEEADTTKGKPRPMIRTKGVKFDCQALYDDLIRTTGIVDESPERKARYVLPPMVDYGEQPSRDQ